MAGRRILLGVIGRPHGVRGLLRVTSYTADPAALASYGPLRTEDGRVFTLAWRGEGIAEFTELRDGVPVKPTDRAAAERLTNTRLYAERDRLPPPAEDEFYLADLVGLAAVDGSGAALGTVRVVHDYGAGASLEIAREGAGPLLVPFTRAAVPMVDIAAGRLTVLAPDEVVGEMAGEAATGDDAAGGQSRSAPPADRPARARPTPFGTQPRGPIVPGGAHSGGAHPGAAHPGAAHPGGAHPGGAPADGGPPGGEAAGFRSARGAHAGAEHA